MARAAQQTYKTAQEIIAVLEVRLRISRATASALHHYAGVKSPDDLFTLNPNKLHLIKNLGSVRVGEILAGCAQNGWLNWKYGNLPVARS